MTLPGLLDAQAAADIVICVSRCVILDALPDICWTGDGVRTLAYRVAGRVPLVLDLVPTRLADDLADAIRDVLDWVAA